jgi:ABC-type nitrate/sulfonate/bicarbonate transport system ATPase subunit|tara:strand:+ start:2201 stop:2755 length:555 start_codon:yes stop_codon:yes gene_type:complete
MKFVGVSPLRRNKILFSPLSFSMKPGQVLVLMGSSGIGKSSLLECVTGNLKHTGEIKGNTNYFNVYQDTEQLFPWMTVLENLQLANNKTNWHKHAEQFKLAHKLENYPNECSVGQRQRFTLLRAIHSGKSVLLCDEPLSGVDSDTAIKICNEFRNYVKQNKKTVLWVTHNQTEAEQLGKIIKLK